MKTLSVSLTIVILAALGGGVLLFAQTAPNLTDEQRQQVLASIESYVRQDAAIKGSFVIVDPRTSEPLALTFDHVHSTVKPVGARYLACVDFKDARGRLYDVDVIVALESDKPRVETVRLHKVEGVAIAEEPK